MARPNVLLIVLDSVRARNVGLYGHAADTTPFLDEWATDATVYEQARAPGVHSIASHVSIFTGHEVASHGLTEHGSQLDPSHTIWDELATDYDYETGLFTPNAVITRSSNLDESFETVVGPKRSDVPYPDALRLSDVEGEGNHTVAFLQRALRHDHPIQSLYNGFALKFGQHTSHDAALESADVYVDEFLDWAADTEGPWASCLNLMDAHYPYEPAAEFDLWGSDDLRTIHDRFPDGPGLAEYLNGERPWWELEAIEALYDGGIRQLDDALSALFDALASRGELEDTFVVVTSDHGECFGEPSLLNRRTRGIGHRYGVFEPLTHVPLVTKAPGQDDGREISDPVSLSAFPQAVRSTIDGADGDAFATDDESIVVSTRRLLDSENLTTHIDDPSPYLGPWRAVYEPASEGVRKYVDHRGTTGVAVVRDAQTSYRVDESAGDTVEERFESLPPVSIGASDHAVDDAVEDHLADLGYVR